MEEEIRTAEKNEEAIVDAGTVEEQGQGVNDETFPEQPNTASENDEGKAEKEKPPQTPEQNAEYARKRREAERQAEIKAEREKTIIETLDGINPYTQEKMTDSQDVEEYLAMRAIKEKGGDPLTDFSKFQKEKNREQATKQAEDEQKREWFEKDREEFSTRYPNVNLETLVQDKQFQLFATGKVGTIPMAEIYEQFTEVVSAYDKKAKSIASQLLANKTASPGALSSPTGNDGYFTKEQVDKMSPEQVHKNYEKIRQSMAKWD